LCPGAEKDEALVNEVKGVEEGGWPGSEGVLHGEADTRRWCYGEALVCYIGADEITCFRVGEGGEDLREPVARAAYGVGLSVTQ
jgi:hypothetical protein